MTDYGMNGVEVTRTLIHRFADLITKNPGQSCIKGIFISYLIYYFI